MSRFLSLAVFVIVVLGGGLLIGYLTLPGEWYASLVKPPFNPPNWVFGPVWSILYVLIAIAGWRSWNSEPYGGAMRAWLAQMLLNFLWPSLFFGLQEIGPALVVITSMLVAILLFIGLSWRPDKLSALLFVPYAAWVGFATMLNLSIFWLN